MILREVKISYSTKTKVEVEKLDTPEKVANAVRHFLESHDLEKEHLIVIALNRKNKPKSLTTVSIGSPHSSIVHAPDVFRPLILQSASAFIVAHNHPSGDPAPSSADMQVTRQLKEAAKIMNLSMLDHVIVGEVEEDQAGLGYYSFNEAGLL